jgi:hypothetical protein
VCGVVVNWVGTGGRARLGSWFQLEFGCAEDEDDAACARVESRRVDILCPEAVCVKDRAAFWPARAGPAVTSLRTVVTRLKVAACCAHAGSAAANIIANDSSPKVLLMTESLPPSPLIALRDPSDFIMDKVVMPAFSACSGGRGIQATAGGPGHNPS